LNAILKDRPYLAVEAADLERIRADQRECNARAIAKAAEESGGFKAWAQETLQRASCAPLVRAIEFWRGDAPAIRAALTAITDMELLINTLIVNGTISDAAADAIDVRLHVGIDPATRTRL